MNYKVSIITATFNSGSTIRDCLDSVKDQGNAVEHIIIDGGSTDGTLDIVKTYPHVSRVISEPDQGIYDAMNKGIALASGDVIGILNSDDVYADHDVLTKVARIFSKESVDSCYGDLLYVDPANITKITRIWKSGPFHKENFYWGWMPPHPTFFVRRQVYEKYGKFNLDLGSAADYELMLRFLVKHKISMAYIPEVLVKMRAGGVSNMSLKNRIRANRMDLKAWEVNGLKPYPWTNFLKPLRKIKQYFV
jgi:glycosyltransferase